MLNNIVCNEASKSHIYVLYLLKTIVLTRAGWGTIYYGGPVAKTLQEVTIPVWTNEDCDDTYEQTIVDTVLCAGAKQGGKDSCQVSKNIGLYTSFSSQDCSKHSFPFPVFMTVCLYPG